MEVIKMTTKMMKKALPALLSLSLILSPATAFAATADFGAGGASTDTDLTLEDMLTYAIQDEYLAKAEYEAILAEFDVTRPFTNILKAEIQHISALVPLFNTYSFILPADTAKDHVILPDTLQEIYSIGVEAEIANIAMYEKFLAQPNLPEDVKTVFTALMNASENHLAAFERAGDRPGTGLGNTAGNRVQSTSDAQAGNGFKGNSEQVNQNQKGNGNTNRSVAVPGNRGPNGTGLGTGLQDGSCLE
jgi:hypothetical protein